MQKILSIVWYKVLPPVFGGQKGIALFNQYLGEQYPLVCLCSITNEPVTGLSYKLIRQLPVNKRQFVDPVVWKKIRSVILQERPTHIILEHPYHALAVYQAKKITDVKIILHAHNIESLRFKRMGKWWWRLLLPYEKWAHQKADLILFKTKADQDYAVTHFNIQEEKCMIVPYGVERKQLPPRVEAENIIKERHGIRDNEKILLFAGTLDYFPNAAAVEAIYLRIAPALEKEKINARIVICGRNESLFYKYLGKLSHSRVIKAGEVADIENYFIAASAFINPVTTGAGIQTKNIDALNCHCNVVCFENMIDCSIKEAAPGKIFMAPVGEWPGFVEKIKEALEHSVETPVTFFDHFEWKNSITRFVVRMEEI